MSLAEWIDGFFGSIEGLLAVLLAAAVFLGLYIYTSSRLQAERTEALERIRQSLTLYTQLAGPLSAAVNRLDHDPEADGQLAALLLECKAADRLTPQLLEQINAYLKDRDHARLPRLSRSLESEMNTLVAERGETLRRLETPGFGLGLWLLLKPAVPGLLFLAVVLLSSALITRLREPSSWTQPELWLLWLSSMLAALSVYRLLMDARRRLPGSLFYGLHLLIAAAALPLFFWPEAAYYTLASQLMLYAAGFWFQSAPSRKERPYAGHPELLEQFRERTSASPEAEDNAAGEPVRRAPEPRTPRRGKARRSPKS
ncbi:hypothetical protein ACH6EH_02860 [Paenibacillus sp. JSM ZJ436]|uniref:hypothetical protein n=1 Tax=Paenibacillus sp. JSM ZJ436 TaxID=3376190 RepID=UPI0037AE84E6